MREFVQEVHNLIGSPADIEALAKKEHARVLVCSDSHGNSQILINIFRQYGKDCDAFIFCGDGTGDIVQVLKLAQTDEVFSLCVPKVIAIVKGNGDPASYPLTMDHTIEIPNRQILTVNNHNLMIVHGHQEGVVYGMEEYGLAMQMEQCSVGFYGHTHVAWEETLGDYKFVNPGSCSRPRGGQPASFAIATVEKNFVDIAYIKVLRNEPGDNQFKIWMPIL